MQTEIPYYVVFQCTATVNILPSSICHHKSGWTSSGHILFCTILFKWWHKFELWLDGMKIKHLKTQTMHVCNIKIKQKGNQFVDISITIHNIYCCNFYLFITLFQSHSSNIQGLCYQTPIRCFIWNFCVQTATHLQQYTPTPFFMPQYLERRSNLPQKRDSKSDTTDTHTI